jgi:hypothetical protein
MLIESSPVYIARLFLKKKLLANCWWLSVIIATWEAKITRIVVPSHLDKKVCETLAQCKKAVRV